MEYLITFIIAFMLGYKLASWISAVSFHELLKELGVTDQQLAKLANRYDIGTDIKPVKSEPELADLEIKLEQHQGVIYAFRLDNDQFLGQGKNREELLDSLKKSLNNVRVIIAEEHGAKLVQP